MTEEASRLWSFAVHGVPSIVHSCSHIAAGMRMERAMARNARMRETLVQKTLCSDDDANTHVQTGMISLR